MDTHIGQPVLSANGDRVAQESTLGATQPLTGNSGPVEVSPQGAGGGSRVAMPPVWGKRVSWLDIPETSDSPYKGLKIRAWTNYPNSLDQDMSARQDPDRVRGAFKQIFIEHNNWPDPDSEDLNNPRVLAPPTTDEFWDKIPNDLAAALIVVLQQEATRYPNSLMPNRNNSRRG